MRGRGGEKIGGERQERWASVCIGNLEMRSRLDNRSCTIFYRRKFSSLIRLFTIQLVLKRTRGFSYDTENQPDVNTIKFIRQ